MYALEEVRDYIALYYDKAKNNSTITDSVLAMVESVVLNLKKPYSKELVLNDIDTLNVDEFFTSDNYVSLLLTNELLDLSLEEIRKSGVYEYELCYILEAANSVATIEGNKVSANMILQEFQSKDITQIKINDKIYSIDYKRSAEGELFIKSPIDNCDCADCECITYNPVIKEKGFFVSTFKLHQSIINAIGDLKVCADCDDKELKKLTNDLTRFNALLAAIACGEKAKIQRIFDYFDAEYNCS